MHNVNVPKKLLETFYHETTNIVEIYPGHLRWKKKKGTITKRIVTLLFRE